MSSYNLQDIRGDVNSYCLSLLIDATFNLLYCCSCCSFFLPNALCPAAFQQTVLRQILASSKKWEKCWKKGLRSNSLWHSIYSNTWLLKRWESRQNKNDTFTYSSPIKAWTQCIPFIMVVLQSLGQPWKLQLLKILWQEVAAVFVHIIFKLVKAFSHPHLFCSKLEQVWGWFESIVAAHLWAACLVVVDFSLLGLTGDSLNRRV